MKSPLQKIKVGITHGDVNGIGYEVIIRTFMDQRIFEFCTPVLYGSPKVLAYHKNNLGINKFSQNNIRSSSEARSNTLNIINCVDDQIKVELGQATKAGGMAAFRSLERAAEDMKNGLIDVLITAPINKKSIQSEDFSFPGHTEYFSEKFNAENTLMILLNENIKVGVVTGHISQKEISKLISIEKILDKLKVLHHSMIQDFQIVKPRIAVLALNPHAGDNGLIGDEEIEIIIPAIEKTRENGILAFGPYPSDGFWGSGDYTKFDAVLGMYHDQGLIPFKMLAFNNGVNYTAGLPFVRTSPSHGTAFALAGKGVASYQSFREALFAAVKIYKNRKNFEEISANPLKTEKNI